MQCLNILEIPRNFFTCVEPIEFWIEYEYFRKRKTKTVCVPCNIRKQLSIFHVTFIDSRKCPKRQISLCALIRGHDVIEGKVRTDSPTPDILATVLVVQGRGLEVPNDLRERPVGPPQETQVAVQVWTLCRFRGITLWKRKRKHRDVENS